MAPIPMAQRLGVPTTMSFDIDKPSLPDEKLPLLEEGTPPLDEKWAPLLGVAVSNSSIGIMLPAPEAAVAPRIGPLWLDTLLHTDFFSACPVHNKLHKCERNHFCLDCATECICQFCAEESHTGHMVIQIRRSSYHDVVRASDIQKQVDLTTIQTYIINSARVVFIRERPQQRLAKGVTNLCESCGRSLPDSVRFCSLQCKLKGILKTDSDATLSLNIEHKKEGDRDDPVSPSNKSSPKKKRGRTSSPKKRSPRPGKISKSASPQASELPLASTPPPSGELLLASTPPLSSISSPAPPSTPANHPQQSGFRSIDRARRRKGVPSRAPSTF
eukprot:SM000090S24345  [mRNA]  locus=s90:509109:510872:+ [translate_table: standard]